MVIRIIIITIGRLGQINWETLVVSSNSDYIARQMCKYYNQDRPSKFLYFSLNVVFNNLFQHFNGELKLCDQHQSFLTTKTNKGAFFYRKLGGDFPLCKCAPSSLNVRSQYIFGNKIH